MPIEPMGVAARLLASGYRDATPDPNGHVRVVWQRSGWREPMERRFATDVDAALFFQQTQRRYRDLVTLEVQVRGGHTGRGPWERRSAFRCSPAVGLAHRAALMAADRASHPSNADVRADLERRRAELARRAAR